MNQIETLSIHQIINPYVQIWENKYWMAPKSTRFIKIPFSFWITSNTPGVYLSVCCSPGLRDSLSDSFIKNWVGYNNRDKLNPENMNAYTKETDSTLDKQKFLQPLGPRMWCQKWGIFASDFPFNNQNLWMWLQLPGTQWVQEFLLTQGDRGSIMAWHEI